MLLTSSRRRLSSLLPMLLLLSLSHGAQEATSSGGPGPPGDSQSWRGKLYDIILPETVETIAADKHLRSTYLAVVGICADTAGHLAQRYQVSQLATISDDLESHLRDISANTGAPNQPDRKRRSPTPNGADGMDKRQDILGGIAGVVGNLTSAVGGLLSGTAGGATSALLGGLPGLAGLGNISLPGAGFFMGVGIGEGTAQGLNITSADRSRAIGARVAQENNIPNTGLNPTVENLGIGLTATALKALGISNLGLTSLIPDLGGTALAFGSGLGTGAALGLNISTGKPQPAPTSDLPAIARSFALGMSRSFAENVNTTGFLGQATQLLAKYGAPAASGFGRGLGSGSAVGLGLQPDQPVAIQAMPDGGVDIAGVSQSFAVGVASRFLANGTASRIMDGLTSPGGVVANLDLGRAANGFMRGLLTGVSDGVEAMGGVDALINGAATIPTGAIPETTITFNDSIRGAAVGFGQGLGTSGVMTVKKLFSSGGGNAQPGPSNQTKRGVPAVGALSRRSAVERRQGQISASPDNLNLSRVLTADAISTVVQKGIGVLGCDGVGGIGLVGLGLTKSGTITVGGLDEKTTSFFTSLIPKDPIHLVNGRYTYDIEGRDVVSRGLAGSVVASVNGISVNGISAIPFAVVLSLHIGLAIAGLTVLFPLALALRSLRSLLLRVELAHILPAWTPRLVKLIWILGVPASVVLILTFGVLAAPKSAHFQSAHSILGLFGVTISLATIPLFFLSTPAPAVQPAADAIPPPARGIDRITVASHVVNQLLLVLIPAVMYTGVADLISLSLCFTQVILTFEVALTLASVLGCTIGFLFLGGLLVSGTDLFVSWRASKRARGKGAEKGDVELLVTGAPPPRLTLHMEKKDGGGGQRDGDRGKSMEMVFQPPI